jgi:hypothetical protein
MRIGSLGKGVTVALLLCLLVSSAHAVCMGPQPRLVCAEYFHEQTVVIAQLLRSHYVEPKGDPIDYHIYSMRAENVLHGRIDPEFRIYEENSSGRANFDWKEGETYLLFLSYSKQDRGWELDSCGNSGLISKSSAALKEIEKISAATNKTGGIISGEVWLETGVTVIAKGSAGTFRGTSDTQGQFHIHVPAGFYSVRAMQLGARFAADDLSYELPRKVYIQNGGCAQISFDRVEPGEVRRRSERLHGR